MEWYECMDEKRKTGNIWTHTFFLVLPPVEINIVLPTA
jgi:hypothetical protein